MLVYTYISPGKFELIDKPKPEIQNSRDAIVRITLGSICTSDLHIKHGSVPRVVPGAYGFPCRWIAIASSPPSYGTNLQNGSLFKCQKGVPALGWNTSDCPIYLDQLY